MPRSAWIKLYTDGACMYNGKPNARGSWAYLLQYNDAESLRAGTCTVAPPGHTISSNRMELLAIVEGLERLNRPCFVAVYSDSQWAVRCSSGEWKRRYHQDLFGRLDKQKARHESILFNWIQGHAGHPENERVDRAANKAL